MAQSLWQKITLLFRASAHSVVDKALEANSVAVIDEYIRQIEENLDNLEDGIVNIKANAIGLGRKYKAYQAEADALNAEIDQLVILHQEDLAMAAQSNYNTLFGHAQEYQDRYVDQQLEVEKLTKLQIKLKARLQTMKREREHILNLLELAKTKEVAVKTIKSLDVAANQIQDTQINAIAEGIRQRLDRADAEVEMRTSTLEQQMDEVLGKDRLSAQLAERRKRLQIEEAGTMAASQ